MNAIKFFTVLSLGAVFTLFQTSPALAECQAFPKLKFWGDMSHTSVQNYVETRFDGDWNAYIENHKVSVNDIITRSLKWRFAK